MSQVAAAPPTSQTGSRARAGSPRSVADVGGEFLTFFLRGEEYGLEILKVQEIIGIMPVTPVPRTPAHIVGIINLRGKVIPIVDLRLRFGMEPLAHTEETCIIVVKANGLQVGIVVDKVSEVLDIAGSDVEDAPSFGTQVNTDYILGIGKSEGRIRLLLDIDRVLAGDDFAALAATPETGEADRAC